MESFFKKKNNEKVENKKPATQILENTKQSRLAVRHRRKMRKIKNPDKKPKMPNPFILFCKEQKDVIR